MVREFENKWALILGGSSGLGLASAKKLAANGMNICIVHRDRKSNFSIFKMELESMRSLGVEVIAFNKDALRKETLDEVLAFLPEKGIKVLLHSLAKGSVKPMLSEEGDNLTKEDFTITINAMALSLYEWSKAIIDKERFAENARILAFTSEGSSKAMQHYATVSAAKATLEALMRNMAVEYAPLEITTNCIQAGITQTASFAMIPGSEKLAEKAIIRNPFKRLTQPEDVARVVYLLCRNEADWINGTVVKVDGGESIC